MSYPASQKALVREVQAYPKGPGSEAGAIAWLDKHTPLWRTGPAPGTRDAGEVFDDEQLSNLSEFL